MPEGFLLPLEEGEDEDAKLKRVEEEALALLQSGTAASLLRLFLSLRCQRLPASDVEATRFPSAEICSGSEAGSYLRRIDFCITPLHAGE